MTTESATSSTFTYQNPDKIDDELLCVICTDPFRSPVNCNDCGQTFCEECIREVSRGRGSCPICRKRNVDYPRVISRALRNQLDRLLVQCSLCDEKNIQRGNFPDHLSIQCPKQLVSCPDKCQWKGCREDLCEHLVKCRTKVFCWSKIRSFFQVGDVFLRFLFLVIVFLALLVFSISPNKTRRG